MAVRLTDGERAVLAAFVALEKADPDGCWNWFYADVVRAAEGTGDGGRADAICRNLRKRKLLKGDGTGKFATYYPTDKGREAVEGA